MARIAVTQRRAELVQAAFRVIAEHGVAGATTRAVTAEAGMSLASFHYAFQSRDELLAELITTVVDRESLAVAEALEPGQDLESTIQLALRAYLEVVIADPAREQAMLELTQYAVRNGGATEQYASYYRAAAALIEALGREWTMPIDQIARLVVTFTDGLTLNWLVHRDNEAAERIIAFAAQSLAALEKRQ